MYEHYTKKEALLLVATTPYSNTFKYLSIKNRNSKEIAKAAIQQNHNAMEYLGDKLKKDKNFIIELMSISGLLLKYVSSELKNDIDVVRAAVFDDIKALSFVPKKLLNNKDVITRLLNVDISIFKHASKKLKQDKDFILELFKIRHFSPALEFVSDELKNDIDVVTAAINQSGWAIAYASAELRSNKQLTMLAVKNNGCAIQTLSKEMRDDEDIVLLAVRSEGYALEYASSRLKNNELIVSNAIATSGSTIGYASTKLQSNKKLANLAISNNASLEDLTAKFKNDKDIVITAINNAPFQVRHASKRLLNDRDVILAAVTKDGTTIKYCGPKLTTDIELYLEALYTTPSSNPLRSTAFKYNKALDFVKENARHISKSDWPIIKEALLKNPDPFLNPPASIYDLCDGMNNKFLYLAQYALAQLLKPIDATDLNHLDGITL